MVQAGAMGVPFIAVRGLLHSDILKHRPDLLVNENPFNPGEQVVMAQPKYLERVDTVTRQAKR